jgi:hypothetical protein
MNVPGKEEEEEIAGGGEGGGEEEKENKAVSALGDQTCFSTEI